jgi:2-methylaconitate cis-trans-isomerase PrpF
VAYRAARHDRDSPGVVAIEHPAGRLETRMSIQSDPTSGVPLFDRAGIVRTARPLLEGVVHIPGDVWRNVKKAA